MKLHTLTTSHPNRMPTGDSVFVQDIASHAAPLDSVNAADAKKPGPRDAKKKKKA